MNSIVAVGGNLGRIMLIMVILLNALVPVSVRASTGLVESPISSTAGRILPSQPSIYYEESESLPAPNRFSPVEDEEEAEVPEKDPIEFSIYASSGEVRSDQTLTVNVKIYNNSGQPITDIGYFDNLEGSKIYISSDEDDLEFNSVTRTVIFRADQLDNGEEATFSYKIKIIQNNTEILNVHNANIEYTYENAIRTQTATMGVANKSSLIDSDAQILIPDQGGDGWNSTGRYSLYLAEEVLTQDAIVSITPADIPGDGPELQFNLELIQIEPIETTSNDVLSEKSTDLIDEIETSFEEPAYLEINLDGYIDLTDVPAGQEPYVATYDEENEVWVKLPIVDENLETNSVVVEAAHFSTWGAGLGNSLPQNGVNVLLFDQPYTSLFTGAARYSLPIWTPPGRAGMTPEVSLSYSSATVDGVLGDVQAPWVGVGWNIDSIEVVRKITTSETGYGYVNQFALTINGATYSLIQDNLHPSRYYTDHDAFLYIERHNYANGNAIDKKGDYPNNDTGEWWEVVTTDGTRYRLGWNNDSEQLTLMYGYRCMSNGSNCQTPDGTYASLGYAGLANNMVALRWRVDRIQDTHGNYIDYSYHEDAPSGGNVIASFDRASYLETISYTGYENSNFPGKDKEPAYKIRFIYEVRSGDIPSAFNIWDNLDDKQLNKIEICYQDCSNGYIRSYDLNYSIEPVPNANGTLTLTSIMTTGVNESVPTQAPTIRFSYQNNPNRAISGNEDAYNYPRLARIDNGAGGVLSYTYETDGRGSNSWYNYRTKLVGITNNSSSVTKLSYEYATPVYAGSGGNQALGELIGYATTTENQLDYSNSDTIILSTVHTFGTTGLDTGRELKTEWKSGATIYRRVTNTYVTDNSKAPFKGWNFRYLYSTLNYELSGGSLVLTTKLINKRDPGSGNLLVNFQYLGSSLYRKTYYEYLINPVPEVYILDTVSRVLTTDASNQILTDTRYHYDGTINNAPTVGDVTLMQKLIGVGMQTVDLATYYDVYGNPESTKTYPGYGTANISPLGIAHTITTTYDPELMTYPIVVTNPLGQQSTTSYLYELGLPVEVTDLNGWKTSTTYDGLGRTLSVTPPGFEQPGIYYSYPGVNSDNGRIQAPYAIEMQILDTAVNPNRYRSVWGLYDGLGRMIQTQVYNEDNQNLLITDTEFNVQGLVSKQGLPYEVSASGGYYISPMWGQFTASTYDPLGRVLTITQPGNLVTSTSYDGLTTTLLDASGNKTTRTTDGLGRLVNIKEYLNSATVYANTYYSYDAADRLVRVLDAKGNESILQYDWMGRKIGMQDPDMGVWTYSYNALNSLTQQVDARGQVLKFEYDPLGRLISKKVMEGQNETLISENTYGSTPGTLGMRVALTDTTGITTWEYGDYGRMVIEHRQINGQTASMTTQNDWLGRPILVTYPDGENLAYTYDALGRPDQLTSNSTMLIDLAYNRLGQIEEQLFGNGINIDNTYNSSNNRLESRTAGIGSVPYLDFSYVYDNVGNITSITDGILNETHTFSYDFLNRLISAESITTENSADYQYRQQFFYDQVGNMTKMNDWIVQTPQAYLTPEPYVDDFLASFSSLGSGSFMAIPARQITSTPTPPVTGLIFADGFESGDPYAWSWGELDNGDLSVSTQAAAIGTYGLQAVVDDDNLLMARDDTPNNESHYSARFYFDPNSIQISSQEGFYLFAASSSQTDGIATIYLEQQGDRYSLSLGGYDDSYNWVASLPVLITDEWQAVEVEWKAATTPGANNGYMKLWIADQLAASIENLDNDSQSVTEAALEVYGDFTGSGTVYFDGFESRQGGHIGLDPNGPAVSFNSSRPDLIFMDGFESNDLSAWNPRTSIDGGDLSVSTSAAHQSGYGLQALIDDANSIKTVDASPAGETRYRTRFYFDPNSLNMSSGSAHYILEGYDTHNEGAIFNLELLYESGAYKIRPRLIRNSGSYMTGSKYTISNDWHALEIEWQASAPGSNNGLLSLWIDGTLAGTINGVDNEIARLDEVYVGATGGVDSSTSGSMYFDHFESRRTTYIGLLSSPTETATPTMTPVVTGTPTATLSNTPSATSTGPTATLTATPGSSVLPIITPLDDATIQNANPTTNYGSATTLLVDNSPIRDFLLKFEVDGINEQSVVSAKLRLYNSDGSDVGGRFYPVTDNSWQEETVTWNTAPAAGMPLIDTLGTVSPGNWYEVDVTSLITQDGTYSLRVSSTSTNGADFSSKEGANSPQLIITVGGVSSTHTPSPTPTQTTPPTQVVTSTNSPTFTRTPVSTNTKNPTPTITPVTHTSTSTTTLVPTSTVTLTPTNLPSLSSSLVGYWNFEPNTISGNVVADVATGGTMSNSATLINGTIIETSGLGAQSAFFDGSNDYASVAGTNDVMATGSFTISAWINPSVTVTGRTQYIVKKGGVNQDYGLITVSRAGTPTPTANPSNFSNGSIAFEVNGLSPKQLIGPVLPNNTWSMVTGVYDASAKQMRLYINGDMVAAQNVTGTISSSSNLLAFSSSTNAFSGRLDEVRLYNRALTSFEVQDVYDILTPPAPSATPTHTITSTPAFTRTPLPMSQQQWGTGNDGVLTVVSTATFNLNLHTNGQGGRTCADAVAYNVTLLGSTMATINEIPAQGCLNPGDEVLLIQLTDSNPNNYNAGNYEFLRVESVSGTSVNFTSPKKYWYGNGLRSDSNIGTGSGQYRVMLMRVPNYSNVTVNGTLTAYSFSKLSEGNGSRYGVVAFRVNGTLNGTGTIYTNGLGFGGQSGYGAGQEGGGYVNQPGGGAGYGTVGGTVFSQGGSVYGSPELSKLFFGSGGGHRGSFYIGSEEDGQWYSGGGGAGGGVVLIAGQTIAYTGSITSQGVSGEGSYNHLAGAGAGGSIRIEGNTISLGTVSAMGGSGYAEGGMGRVAVYYQTSYSINSTPNAYIASLGQPPTATPMPTSIYLTPSSNSNWGTGMDGELIVNTGQTFNLSTTKANGVICPGGGDGVSYSVVGLLDSSATLLVEPHPNCLKAGDEVLLIHVSGSGANIGNYEFLRVGGITKNIVYFTTPKNLWYGSGMGNDTNVGTEAGQQRVILVRVPNYSNVTVNGTLTAYSFSKLSEGKGLSYGVVAFRVNGTLNGTGTIHTNGLGFGGQSGYGAGQEGGGNKDQPGGGGGHGSEGQTVFALGGIPYGNHTLSKAFFGSGGGAHGSFWVGSEEDGQWYSGGGGAGGGMVLIAGQTINYSGSIEAKGLDGFNNYGRLGGGGAGGSIRIVGDTIHIANISAQGGGLHASGGRGRVAIYYYTSYTGNSATLPYMQKMWVGATPSAVPTQTPDPLWGSGTDGNLTVSSGTFNISTDNSNGRSCADGGDAVSYSVVSLYGGVYARLSTVPGANCLKPNDEVMLIHVSGSGPNTGHYEFFRVQEILGDTIVFTTPKTLYYGHATNSDASIGTQSGWQKVMLIRVPNYNNVTINGTLTALAYDGAKNGVVVFRNAGVLNGNGSITMNGAGFPGASGYGVGENGAFRASGQGGSYGTNGWNTSDRTYGVPSLSNIYLGSGGGNSGKERVYNEEEERWMEVTGPAGARGGGMILLSSRTINFSGHITANGNPGQSFYYIFSGSGSGGSIRIQGDSINLNSATVTASGGNGSCWGGQGRIAVYYQTSFSGNFTPGYQQQIGAATPTPMPTVIPSNPGTNGLVSWWTMNEASGQRNDSHSTNHLTDNNSLGVVVGKQGSAAHFVSATPAKYLSIADNTSLSTGNVDFTISALVYLNSTAQTMILVNKGDKDNVNLRDLTLYFDQPTMKFGFRVGNGTANATVLSATTVTTGRWYLVTAWHNAANDTLNIQINNGTVSTASYTSGAMDTTHPFTIGAFSDGTYGLVGRLDEVVFYKRVLTAAERAWLYNAGLGRSYADVNPPAQSGWKTRDYIADVEHPHAVAAVKEDQVPVASYDYDANGNMTCRTEDGVTYLQTYNAENRIASITRLASGDCAAPGNYLTKWDFGYDGDGVRVATLTTTYDANNTPSVAEWTSYYFGGAYEVRSDNTVIKYYSFAGQLVAMNDGTGLQYFLTDHLGSVVAVTDANGALITQQRYLPFGGERTNVGTISQTDYGYTGQRDLDPGMGGLMDYKARFYSPYLNRFIQPDTLIPDPANSQAWNRYAYVYGNPILYTDPSGHAICLDGIYCGTPTNPSYQNYAPPSSTTGGQYHEETYDPENLGGNGDIPALDGIVNGKGPGLNAPAMSSDDCIILEGGSFNCTVNFNAKDTEKYYEYLKDWAFGYGLARTVTAGFAGAVTAFLVPFEIGGRIATGIFVAAAVYLLFEPGAQDINTLRGLFSKNVDMSLTFERANGSQEITVSGYNLTIDSRTGEYLVANIIYQQTGASIYNDQVAEP